ncbi:hypothetical protein [Streptomyces niveus]
MRSCGYLRTREVGTLQVPLDASVVNRLCPRCADNGPRVRQETGLGIFLDALGGLGLLYQLGSHTGPEEDEEWNREEVEAAAALLRSPPADPGTDEEDDDAAEEAREVRDEAERIRDGVLSEWRRAATSLHQARRTVLSFAWLEQWAQPKLLMKEQHLALLRGQAVLFVDVAGLATAAAVAVMDEPQLPAGDEAFKILGTTADITRGLRSLWGKWQRHVSGGWDQPAEHSWIAHSLVGSISSRRKGRDQVLAAAEALLATWAEHAHQVAVAGTVPDVLLTVTLPEPLGEEPHRRGREWLDHLDTWELGVLVTFLTDADWARGVLTVRVPELIARRLLDRRSTLACTPHQSTPSSTAAEGTRSAPGADHPIGPGIFDDTPVADRRLVTITHLKALRAASGVADQLYLVFSTERGAEVLPLAALESRCEQGWQGIILAGASDLPGQLIERQKTTPANPLDDEPGQEHSTGRRHRDHQDPFFGQHLSTDHALQAMERQSYFDQDREHNLRSLAMARGAKDLRTLDGGRDFTGRPSDAVPAAVWDGLLAMSTLDLRPFRAPREDRWNSGSGIPLAILADVQIYTTNADPLVEGKGHSPDCQHAGRGGVSRHDDLLTLAQLLDKEDMDWCGKCGGYTVRRLTPAQLAHYRAAHRLHAVATTLRGDRPSAHDTLDTASLVSELDELAAWRTDGLEDDSPVAVADTWRWKQIVEDLSNKAHAWDRARTAGS